MQSYQVAAPSRTDAATLAWETAQQGSPWLVFIALLGMVSVLTPLLVLGGFALGFNIVLAIVAVLAVVCLIAVWPLAGLYIVAGCAILVEAEQAVGILRHSVDDLRRRNAVVVLEFGIKHDAVGFIR